MTYRVREYGRPRMETYLLGHEESQKGMHTMFPGETPGHGLGTPKPQPNRICGQEQWAASVFLLCPWTSCAGASSIHTCLWPSAYLPVFVVNMTCSVIGGSREIEMLSSQFQSHWLLGGLLGDTASAFSFFSPCKFELALQQTYMLSGGSCLRKNTSCLIPSVVTGACWSELLEKEETFHFLLIGHNNWSWVSPSPGVSRTPTWIQGPGLFCHLWLLSQAHL